jgi:hypothetical protein
MYCHAPSTVCSISTRTGMSSESSSPSSAGCNEGLSPYAVDVNVPPMSMASPVRPVRKTLVKQAQRKRALSDAVTRQTKKAKLEPCVKIEDNVYDREDLPVPTVNGIKIGDASLESTAGGRTGAKDKLNERVRCACKRSRCLKL